MSTFSEIYAAEYSMAIRFAQRRCGLQDDMADQIVSDTFFHLHNALEDGIEIENPIAWLRRTICIRHAEFLRRELRVKRGGRFYQRELPLWGGADLAIEHLGFEAVDATDTIQSIWDRLTKAEQGIAEMAFMRELNQTEIADQLGVTLRTVERRVNRVRNRLRTLLSTP